MSDSSNTARDRGRREREQIRLAKLEAEMAYFRARLEILGEPETANQQAQLRAYRLLYKGLGELLLQSKRRLRKAG